MSSTTKCSVAVVLLMRKSDFQQTVYRPVGASLFAPDRDQIHCADVSANDVRLQGATLKGPSSTAACDCAMAKGSRTTADAGVFI